MLENVSRIAAMELLLTLLAITQANATLLYFVILLIKYARKLTPLKKLASQGISVEWAWLANLSHQQLNRELAKSFFHLLMDLLYLQEKKKTSLCVLTALVLLTSWQEPKTSITSSLAFTFVAKSLNLLKLVKSAHQTKTVLLTTKMSSLPVNAVIPVRLRGATLCTAIKNLSHTSSLLSLSKQLQLIATMQGGLKQVHVTSFLFSETWCVISTKRFTILSCLMSTPTFYSTQTNICFLKWLRQPCGVILNEHLACSKKTSQLA